MINNSSYINFLNNEEVLNSYINKHTYEIVGNGVDLGIRCKKRKLHILSWAVRHNS